MVFTRGRKGLSLNPGKRLRKGELCLSLSQGSQPEGQCISSAVIGVYVVL